MEPDRWFASCPKGLEGLLLPELQALGASQTRETVGGCHFQGGLAVAYRACLWSRLANRILMPLTDFEVGDSASLHEGLLEVPWSDYLGVDGSFIVDFSGQSGAIRNTQYGAQVCKDAVSDHFRDKGLSRPDVSRRDADVRINVRLRKGRVVAALDMVGGSLHQRGYRLEAGEAPLKENLACAMLLRADWPGIAARGGALIDPMCGSATLLLEAAMMVADIAPGLARERWSFEHLGFHNPGQWQSLLVDAQARAERGRARELPEIRGYDADARVLRKAQANIDRAGLQSAVRVSCKPLAELRKPTHRAIETGLVISNPPYGERLGEKESLKYLYRELGDTLLREFGGWQAALLTSDKELGMATGLRSRKQYALFNGSLASTLLLFDLEEENRRRPDRAQAGPDNDGGASSFEQLSPGAQMFGNRLRKNQRKLERWARREGISCYRLYDADMPEYAVAIDRYEEALHVAEYRAPSGVKEEDARRRLEEVAAALPLVTGIDARHIHYKERRRQRGKEQYQRVERRGEFQTVREGSIKLLVNLSDYLDTGLFLDHRALRLRLAAEARGKSFLNLYCYTGAATVHAAAGGARSTTSVDLSRTYLDWARKNMAVNGFDESRHQLVQADCLPWLLEDNGQYDLVLLDPPSFSNSKRMEGHFDVQRDHVELLRAVVARLSDDGVLYFSNNLRSFKLDTGIEAFCQVEDITRSTLDEDFRRRANIHHCWRIKRSVQSS
jgi:23S rRNA (guanine2445-N2)-methyltransferase / 23S rRNA (guanine2069-N7)-methyltransferase